MPDKCKQTRVVTWVSDKSGFKKKKKGKQSRMPNYTVVSNILCKVKGLQWIKKNNKSELILGNFSTPSQRKKTWIEKHKHVQEPNNILNEVVLLDTLLNT